MTKELLTLSTLMHGLRSTLSADRMSSCLTKENLHPRGDNVKALAPNVNIFEDFLGELLTRNIKTSWKTSVQPESNLQRLQVAHPPRNPFCSSKYPLRVGERLVR